MSPSDTFFQSLTGITLTPVTIRRIFLLLTRLHYSTPDNYGTLKKKLDGYVWSKEATKSKLHIDYDYHYNPSELDDRPAIFVGLDDIEYRKSVLGSTGNPTPSGSGQYFVKTGVTKIILRHISKSADDVLALGDLSVQFFNGITPMIRDSLSKNVMEYDVVGLKSSRPFEKTSQQADQHFMSDLIIAFSYNATWLTEFESHRIKTISFQQSLAECSQTE